MTKQFYQLTLEEVIRLHKQGEISTLCAIRFYMQIKFAPGWQIIIDREEVMKLFGISIHQFRRAIAKLKNELDIFIKSVRKVSKAIAVGNPTFSERRSSPELVQKVAPSANKVNAECTNSCASSANKVTPSANTNPQTTSKTNTSSDQPDIRSNIDHISLSDKPKIDRVGKLKEEEREKFLSFASNKVNELPKRPTLPNRWIAANFDDLYSEFQLSVAGVAQSTNIRSQFAEWYDLMKQLGHVVDQKVKDGKHFVLRTGSDYWFEYEIMVERWTMDYLKKCVKGR